MLLSKATHIWGTSSFYQRNTLRSIISPKWNWTKKREGQILCNAAFTLYTCHHSQDFAALQKLIIWLVTSPTCTTYPFPWALKGDWLWRCRICNECCMWWWWHLSTLCCGLFLSCRLLCSWCSRQLMTIVLSLFCASRLSFVFLETWQTCMQSVFTGWWLTVFDFGWHFYALFIKKAPQSMV